jgi:phospholipid transport system substrate-binding protein
MKYLIERAACGALLAVALWWLATFASAATDTPAAVVESLHGGLIELANASAAPDIETRYERLRPLIEQTHDLPYIARFSVGRHWSELTAAEQQQFVATFERLSIMTYASRFVRLDRDTFEMGGVNDLGNGRVEVESSIRRPDGTRIPLDYVLTQRDGGWRIINIVADGVSDLALKRAEYQQLLANGSFADLERHLEEQVAELEDGAAQPTKR